jgi:hypothetical protein
MKHNRWFNWVVTGVLVALAIITARQFAANAQVVSANASQPVVTQAEKMQNPFACPFTPEQIRSIHPGYIAEIGHSVPFTKDGPTGVEGGLYMLRYCKAP